MLQQDEPDDYVLATGETTMVRDFVDYAYRQANVTLEWSGNGVEEQGVDLSTGKVLVQVDPRYFRPTEVDLLIGESSEAERKLGWGPIPNGSIITNRQLGERGRPRSLADRVRVPTPT